MAEPEGPEGPAGYVALLRRLVELESPSGAVPYLDELRDLLVELLTGAGAQVRVEPGAAGDHLVAELGGGPGPRTMLLGHYDTVWPVGRLADAPFVVGRDTATGPGVFDMKAGLVILIGALRRLDSAARRPRPLRIVITADEEVGSPDGGRVVESACADVAEVFALEPPLPAGRLKVGRRGVALVRVEVTGREAHTGLDLEKGVSAISELMAQLRSVEQRFPPTSAASLNIGTITGGTRPNVVAGRAWAEVGLRFATPEDERRIVGSLTSLTATRPGATVTGALIGHRPAWEPSQSMALAAQVVALAAALGEEIDTGVSGGAGDANLTGAAGIPTVDGLGARGHGAHSADETVELSSIPQRTELLYRLITR